MKFVKQLAKGLVIAAMLALLPIQNTHAAADLNQENFDYDWYLEQHPDLAVTVPADDHDAIWQFYQTVGKPAGWLGRRSKISYLTKDVFDYDTFLEQNPDVYAIFGTNYDQVYEWYITTGIYEGRTAQAWYIYADAPMKIYDIADSITDSSMSTREKVKAVHDWICLHVTYGDCPYEYELTLVGPILYGKAVCGGYADIFQAFMEVLGIEGEYIGGKATIGGRTGSHAWNKVKIDGQWYWLDVTWDDRDYNASISYDYFLISEDQMNKNHYPTFK